jgi:vacuolar-type H+-ATPase subunit H
MPRRGDEGEHSADGEEEALLGLRQHEQELDRRLAEARNEAKDLLDEAAREAECLQERAKAELAEAVTRLRQEQAQELERAVAAIHEDAGRRRQALSLQAALNRERVLAWLLARVTGRDPP